MARTVTSQLIVELLDRVTGPAKAVSRSMAAMGRRIGDATGSLPPLTQRVDAALARNRAALDNARAGVVDAAAAYYTLRAAIGAPIRAAADFETLLEDIGQKAEVPVERLGALGDRIQEVARQTNQANGEIAAAVDALAGRGASIDVAMTAAAPIGKAATAYRAATDDLASASWAAVDNLKVPADQIGRSLDMMAQAGKEGAFELRDMAQYFPALGAAYQGLGQTGVESVADLAAALQVVRKGTGDSSTAATNLANVLQKIYAPGTVRKFAAQGVDVFAEMEAAAERGLTPIEAIAELADRTLQGDLSKMGNLFEDAQVQAGMRSLIQNMEEYRRIRAEAMNADGVVDEDFERRIRTTAGMMKRWSNMTDRLSTTIGEALTPALIGVIEAIEPIIDRIGDLIAANPRLASSLMLATGSLIAFRGALAALRFVGLLGKGGALSLLSFGLNAVAGTASGVLGAAGASAALQRALAGMDGRKAGVLVQTGAALRGMAAAAPGAALARTAIVGVASAVGAISAPAWLGIAAAVAAVGAAWKYWDRVEAIARGVADVLGPVLRPAVEAIRDWMEPVEPVIRRFGEAFASIDRLIRGAANAVRSLGRGLFSREILTDAETNEIRARAARLTEDLIAKVGEIAAGIRSKAGELKEAGVALIQSLWDGAKERFADLLKWARGIAAEIRAAIGDVGMGALSGGRAGGGGVTTVVRPDGSVGIDASGLSAPRAKGGPVSAGSTRLVGEDGPELFTASRSGYVHSADKTARGVQPVVNLNPVINVSGVGDPEGVARRVLARLSEEAAAAMRSAMADIELG